MSPADRIPFPDLDPPSGGVDRFRMRLGNPDDASHAVVARWAAAGGVMAVLAIIAMLVLAPPDVAEPATTIVFDAPEFDRLLGRPLQQVETTAMIDDEPVTLSAMPVTTPGIRIYEVRPN